MGVKKEYSVLVDSQPIYVGSIRTSQVVYESILKFRDSVLSHPGVSPDDVPVVVLAFGRV